MKYSGDMSESEAASTLTFGKVEPSQPMEVRFEWYSDNYDVTPKAIVFQVAP